MLRKIVACAVALASLLPSWANPTDSLSTKPVDRMIFNHLDASVSLGTTGLGLEVSTPLTKYLRVRAGVQWMPSFSMPVSFGLETYKDGVIGEGNFSRQQELMKKLTGIDVDDQVDMDAKPHLVNFKFLVDIYPWTDTRWHLTAGFYAGPRKIARAINSMNEMHSLFAVNLYNNYHDHVLSDDFLDTPIYGDVFIDPELGMQIQDEMAEAGKVGIHVGDFKDGTPYMMTPDSEGMVHANAYVNSFRPYLGFGYGGTIGGIERLSLSFDAGVLMWGKPKIITHDGTNLAELENIKGKVGTYVDVVKSFRVYPVVEVKLTYSFF